MTLAEPRRSPSCPTERDARGGFTMIEVVAAVVILGVWFTLLVTIVSDGVATETTNRIRLEASLIADEALADAEALLLAGGAVKPWAAGDEHPYGEYADAPFDVVVTAVPFDPLGSLAPREGAALAPQGLGIDVSALPPGQQAAALAALLEIRVEVYPRADDFDLLDPEGEAPHAYAMRTTYAIDPVVLSSLSVPEPTRVGGAPRSDGTAEATP